jgi:arylsulfatase A
MRISNDRVTPIPMQASPTPYKNKNPGLPTIPKHFTNPSIMKNPLYLHLLFLSAAILSAKQPNIVIMLADDLGSGDLSCYGSPENQTPNLDKLASQGIQFSDFYAACAVCSPSRAALQTGRFSVRAGIYSWVAPSQKMHLRVEETTIAELLKSGGYSTAHIGKWHLGYNLEEGTGGPNPGDHGYDYWIATGNNAVPSHHNPTNFVRNGKALGEVEGYSCQILADETIGWLDNHTDKNPGKPFFINICFHEPHQRVASPPELAARHPNVKQPEYYGAVENMDNAAGRILKKLDEIRATDNTLVFFTSDNGSYRTDRSNNRNLKGRKTQLWEGGIREPGIIRWPGKIKPGSQSDVPAGLVDILPTACAAAGVPLPQGVILDGTSLLPLFANGTLCRTKPLYWFYNPSRPVCVIRDGDYCLLADPEIDLPKQNMFLEKFIGDIKATALTNFRLHNLRADATQDTDLSGKEPETFSRMKKQMLELHRNVMDEAFDWRTLY